MSIKIAIAGCAGRMGQTLVRIAGAGKDFTVVGGSEKVGSGNMGRDIGEMAGLPALGLKAVPQPNEAGANAQVWLDFTTPAATLAALDALSATPVKAAIVGTTGWSQGDEERIRMHARRIAIVKAGNFSLGVNLMLALVEQAAERLGADWDIEISEMHHNQKVDAPSGTALMIGEAAARGRGAKLTELRTPPYDGMTGKRTPGRIGFSSRRAGAVIGDHEVMFGSGEEILSFTHRATDRALFARGALAAAKWAVEKPAGLYSMRDVLNV